MEKVPLLVGVGREVVINHFYGMDQRQLRKVGPVLMMGISLLLLAF
jgi:hypothetical protein